MLRSTLLLCLLSIALSAYAANATTDAGLAEVKDLGHINGLALACDFTETSSRIKAVMIANAPKSRRYGAAFEEATNQAFLDQTRKEPVTCPDGPTLNDLTEKAAQRLLDAIHASKTKKSP